MVDLRFAQTIDDVIDAGGSKGKVSDIGLLATVLNTPDNQKIIIPNSSVMGGTITNVNAYDTRRVDMTAELRITVSVLGAAEMSVMDYAALEAAVRPIAPCEWWPEAWERVSVESGTTRGGYIVALGAAADRAERDRQ